MSQTDTMIKLLSDVLLPDERLFCPIYATYTQLGEQYSAYFGLTETHLLVTVLSPSGKKSQSHARIPLSDIISMKVKRGALGLTNITLSIEGMSPITISAEGKVFRLKEQEENLPVFIQTLTSVVPNDTQEKRSVDGKKVRKQTIVSRLGFFLSFLAGAFILLLAIEIRKKEAGMDIENVFAYPATIALITLAIVSPAIIAAILNRFCFGEVVFTSTEQGMYMQNEFFRWREIRSIYYTPETFKSRNRSTPSIAVIKIKTDAGDDKQRNVEDFPAYALRLVKKQAPHVEIKRNTRAYFERTLIYIAPVVLFYVFSFFI